MPQPQTPKDKTPPPAKTGGVKTGPETRSFGDMPPAQRQGGMESEGGPAPAPKRDGGMIGEG